MTFPTQSQIALDEAMAVFKAQTNLKPLMVKIAGHEINISSDKRGSAIVWAAPHVTRL